MTQLELQALLAQKIKSGGNPSKTTGQDVRDYETAVINTIFEIALLKANITDLHTHSNKSQLDTYSRTQTQLDAFIQQKIDDLIANAPEAFNTLMEIATQLQEDETALSGLLTSVGNHTTAIGDLTTLKTAIKTSLVSAVNELYDILKKTVNNYDPVEVVSSGQYRAYNTKFWLYINAVPSAGQTPAEGAYWTEVSKDEASAVKAGQTEVEAAANAALATGADDIKFVTSRGLFWFWTKVKTLAQTFAAKITFTIAPRFSSVTASQVLKVDSNKDLTSGLVANSEMATMPALSVKVNNTNTVGSPTDFQATVAERVFVRGASNLFSFIQLTTNYYADLSISQAKIILKAVGNTQMADMPANSVKSNLTGTLAPPSDNPAVDLWNNEQQMLGWSQDGVTEILSATLNTIDSNIIVTNSTAKTPLFSFTIPAYIIRNKKEFEISLEGIISTAVSPGNLIIDSDLGAVQLGSSGAIVLSGSQTDEKVRIKFRFTCRTAGVTGTVIGQGYYNDHKIIMTTTATVDTTTDLIFKISATWSTAEVANILKITNGRIIRNF